MMSLFHDPDDCPLTLYRMHCACHVLARGVVGCVGRYVSCAAEYGGGGGCVCGGGCARLRVWLLASAGWCLRGAARDDVHRSL